jgi:GH24 family phage-related lysozyme (muramidase)
MAAKTTDPIDILLEMGIDLDNLSEEEDYLSALKEAIATIEFKTGGKGDERSAALREEVIKVRKSRKAADSKFKEKKTTIKPENLFQRRLTPKQNTLPSVGAIVPYQAPESEEEGVKKKRALREKTSDPLKDILKSVNSILATLKNQNKITKKQAERDRKDAERAKRGAQEDDLEKAPLKKFFDNAKKLAKPAIGFFESIMKFIVNVLIGRLLVKILSWMGDPENKKKMDAIMDFFKVTWPAFLAAFLAFKFGLLGFMGGLIGLIGRFIPKILGLIPKMLKGLKTLAMGNPVATAATAVVAGTAIAAIAANQDGTAVIKDPDDPDKSQADEIREFGGMTGAPISGDMLGFNLGGLVPGSGPDKDTVPAMLTPGEFVMSRGAVQKYGSDTLAGMNAMGGGTNVPSTGMILGYNGGGLVDEKPERPRIGATSGSGSPDEFAKPMIKIHEGLRLDKYMDSRGFPTIGYGHLIEPGESMPNRISQQKADELFDEDYTHHKAAAMRIPGYDRANAMQKAALIDLTFNMGPAWADGFPKFKQAFAAGNYEQAGNELIDSAYYGQVGRRGPTIVNLIKGKGADNVAYLKGVPTPAPGPSSSQPQIASVGSVGGGQRLSDLSAAQSTRSGGSAPPLMSYAGSSRSLPPPSRGTRLSDLRKNQEMRAASSQEPKEYPNPGALNTPNSNDLPPIDANAMISMEKIKVLGLTVV